MSALTPSQREALRKIAAARGSFDPTIGRRLELAGLAWPIRAVADESQAASDWRLTDAGRKAIGLHRSPAQKTAAIEADVVRVSKSPVAQIKRGQLWV